MDGRREHSLEKIYKLVYNCKEGNKSYSGYHFEDTPMKQYLQDRVKKKYYNYEGTKKAIDQFGSLATTGFEYGILSAIFQNTPDVIFWKIGEVFAESFLEDYGNAFFPFDSRIETKNPRESRAGADLVGFVNINSKFRFLFGQVKTSDDTSVPPTVVYDLMEQLQDLKNNQKLRALLINWLQFKVIDLPTTDSRRISFYAALKIYISMGCSCFKIVGILIKIAQPNEKDVKNAFTRMSKDMSQNTHLDLSAIYTSVKSEEFINIIKG